MLKIEFENESFHQSPVFRKSVISPKYIEALKAGITTSSGPFQSLGDNSIELVPNYASQMFVDNKKPVEATIAQYLCGDSKHYSPEIMCPEQPLGDDCNTLFQFSFRDHTSETIPPIANIHVGISGAATPLHFDWDFRRVHHINLFGAKTIWLMSPEDGKFLPAQGNISPYDPTDWMPDEYEKFLSAHGAQKYELEAGDSLSFPALFWHTVTYQSPSLALSVRFETDPAFRFLPLFPGTILLQILLFELVRQENWAEIGHQLASFLAIMERSLGAEESYRLISANARQRLDTLSMETNYPKSLEMFANSLQFESEMRTLNPHEPGTSSLNEEDRLKVIELLKSKLNRLELDETSLNQLILHSERVGYVWAN